MTSLSRQWLAYVEALGNASTLLSEASSSQQPQQHLLRVIHKFAPPTLTRYFAEWKLWVDFATALGECPCDPPRWNVVRACRFRSLSLSGWNARLLRYCSVAPCSPASGHRCDGGDTLWVPPSRLQLLPEQSALVGSATHTKTTTNTMPFSLLTYGLSGTPSQNWAGPRCYRGVANLTWTPSFASRGTITCPAPTNLSSFTSVMTLAPCLPTNGISLIMCVLVSVLQPLARGTSLPLPDFPVQLHRLPIVRPWSLHLRHILPPRTWAWPRIAIAFICAFRFSRVRSGLPCSPPRRHSPPGYSLSVSGHVYLQPSQ